MATAPGEESQASVLSGAGVPTSLLSHPYHRDRKASLDRQHPMRSGWRKCQAQGLASMHFLPTAKVGGARDLWSTSLLCDVRLVTWLLWASVEEKAMGISLCKAVPQQAGGWAGWHHGTGPVLWLRLLASPPTPPSSLVSLPHLLDPVVNSPSLRPLAGWTGSLRLRHAEQCLALDDEHLVSIGYCAYS